MSLRKALSASIAPLLSGASAFAVGVLWLCAGSAWINPSVCKWLGLLGLGYPLALLGVLFFLFLCFVFAPRRSWIALLGLISTWGFTMDYAPLQLFPPVSSSADTTTLRVLSYNTENFGGNDSKRRNKLIDYVSQQQPDIFCFQEGTTDPNILTRVSLRLQNAGLQHLRTIQGMGGCVGVATRFPIVRHEEVSRSGGNAVGAFWITPNPGDTLLVLSCHLRSNSLSIKERSNYNSMLHGRSQEDGQKASSASRSLLRKIAQNAVHRAQMANDVVAFLAQHLLPTIVCGDMNETAISYSHHRFTQGAGLTDVYRAAGSGIGRSFNQDAIYVRIDHGFCSEHFEPLRATVDQRVHHSDHYPLLMQLRRKG